MGRAKGSKNKPKGEAPQAAGSADKGHNGGPPNGDAVRAEFVDTRKMWLDLKNKEALYDKEMRDVHAKIKTRGFTVKQMKIADMLNGTAKDSEKVKTEVKERLQVAQWIGHPMGAQLDLFAQPDRTPSVDQAYDNGKMAAMEGKVATPPHDASSPQYQSWLSGYHDEQARRVREGIKPLEPKEPPTPLEQAVKANGRAKGPEEVKGDPEGDRPAEGWGKSKGEQKPAAGDEPWTP